MTFDQLHEQTLARLLEDPHWAREYGRNQALRDAWNDPYTDYDTLAGVPTVIDPLQIGRDDLMLLVMIENPDAELSRAWARITAAQRAGKSRREAVELYGIRGHPDFADYWPVTPPPHGDAAWATTELARRQQEAVDIAKWRAEGRSNR